MKIVKGILVAGALLVGMTTMAQEKEQKAPEVRAKEMAQKMKKQLELDDAQTKKIEAANLETINEKRKIQEEIKKLREKVKAIKADRKAKYKEILTDEQFKKLEEMIEKRKAKRKANGPRKGKGLGPK